MHVNLRKFQTQLADRQVAMPPRICCVCGKPQRSPLRFYAASDEVLAAAADERAAHGKPPRLNAFDLCGTHQRWKPVTRSIPPQVATAAQETTKEIDKVSWCTSSHTDCMQQSRPNIVCCTFAFRRNSNLVERCPTSPTYSHPYDHHSHCAALVRHHHSLSPVRRSRTWSHCSAMELQF